MTYGPQSGSVSDAPTEQPLTVTARAAVLTAHWFEGRISGPGLCRLLAESEARTALLQQHVRDLEEANDD